MTWLITGNGVKEAQESLLRHGRPKQGHVFVSVRRREGEDGWSRPRWVHERLLFHVRQNADALYRVARKGRTGEELIADAACRLRFSVHHQQLREAHG